MAPEDEDITKDMAPEQQECFLAGLKRGEEIRAQIDAALRSDCPAFECVTLVLDLSEELEELVRRLERMAMPGQEPQSPPVDYAWLRLAITLQREQREPTDAEHAILFGYPPRTATEIAILELAERLAAKHGTTLPDFEVFYRWRSELDDRAGSGGPGGREGEGHH